jgi:hypothetical protein
VERGLGPNPSFSSPFHSPRRQHPSQSTRRACRPRSRLTSARPDPPARLKLPQTNASQYQSRSVAVGGLTSGCQVGQCFGRRLLFGLRPSFHQDPRRVAPGRVVPGDDAVGDLVAVHFRQAVGSALPSADFGPDRHVVDGARLQAKIGPRYQTIGQGAGWPSRASEASMCRSIAATWTRASVVFAPTIVTHFPGVRSG